MATTRGVWKVFDLNKSSGCIWRIHQIINNFGAQLLFNSRENESMCTYVQVSLEILSFLLPKQQTLFSMSWFEVFKI